MRYDLSDNEWGIIRPNQASAIRSDFAIRR
jgi:hypothetical protein